MGGTRTSCCPTWCFQCAGYLKHPLGSPPFGFLYGRWPRGLLDLAKEVWEEQPTPLRSVVEHVEEMRERMTEISPMVRKYMARVQRAQERGYNRGAQPREFQPGEKDCCWSKPLQLYM